MTYTKDRYLLLCITVVSLCSTGFCGQIIYPWNATCAMATAGAETHKVLPKPTYRDGRPAATLRMDAEDQGIVLRYGDGPGQCDMLGARDVWVFEEGGIYYMHYDAAGPKGWLCSLAVSKDLLTWEKKGPILDFGEPGEDDSKSASYGVTYCDGDEWHMFYLGTPNVSAPPNLVPSFPYLTMKAKGSSAAGPWIKQKGVIPFRTKPGTYYSITASPGQVVKQGDEYVQFFSATTRKPGNPCVQRTLGMARTRDLDGPWTVDPRPIVPIEEQIENASVYYEESSQTWFLFTNHIGIDKGEYTDAIWVYWSKDLNQWDPENKAIVLDGENCTWSSKCIGLPSVLQVGKRLALFYDAPGGSSTSHMKRHVGLAWLDLPLTVPKVETNNPFTDNLAPAPIDGAFKMADYIVWGGSVTQGDDGRYYMFASRWPKEVGMRNWVTNSEVVLASSDRAEGPYTFEKVVLPPRGPEYWDGMVTHNPTIHRHEGKYILFYVGSTYAFPRPEETVDQATYGQVWNGKRVGVAIADSPFGPWKRLDQPIMQPRPGEWDGAIISNPAPVIHEDGSVLLIYKSAPVPYPERNNNRALHFGVARAPHYLGPYKRVGHGKRLEIGGAEGVHVEDPYVWHVNGTYHMVAKIFSQELTGEKGAGFYAYSKNGTEWNLPQNPQAYSRTVLFSDGTERHQTKLERPQVLVEDGTPTHIFFATADPEWADIYNLVIPLSLYSSDVNVPVLQAIVPN